MISKIFNSDQIRAIQDGRMTQFMQEVKPQPDDKTNIVGGVTWEHKKGVHLWGNDMPELILDMYEYSPFGKVGDVIYCRETWIKGITIDENEKPVDDEAPRFWYKADNNVPDWYRPELPDDHPNYLTPPWKSSTTMPREAARLFLRITNIRVMRVQELDDQDFYSQGIEERAHHCGGCGFYEAGGYVHECCCQEFKHPPMVMGFIDADKRNEAIWQANKYFWIIDFTKTDKP